jgi:hypothetical protein
MVRREPGMSGRGRLVLSAVLGTLLSLAATAVAFAGGSIPPFPK